MPHILIVEDDPDAARALAGLLRKDSYTTAIAGSLAEARQQFALRTPDVVLLDLVLPDGSGLTLFDQREEFGGVDIVLMTGHATVETSVQAFRLGAVDYLIKPVSPKQFDGVLARVGRSAESRAALATVSVTAKDEGRFGHLRGRADVMQTLYTQIGRVAGTAVTVFIVGESGAGKEVVAQTVHDLSRRKSEPFLAVNCGAVSPQLIESEMFGHEKGSFTGANRQHRGFFERANGGTLFLDEVTEMSLELQVKLLRVLETGTFMRVGSDEAMETDVRIIAATNREPAEAVATGKLREDLFYRLNVFQIRVPPLRDRLDDVAILAEHFLASMNEREKSKRQFAPSALEKLAAYPWPGNVRELRNVVQRAYIMSERELIDADCIPFDPPQRSNSAHGVTSPVTSVSTTATVAVATERSKSPRLTATSVEIPLGTSLANAERLLILATMEAVDNKRDKAAELLGISAKTLYNRLREYGTPLEAG